MKLFFVFLFLLLCLTIYCCVLCVFVLPFGVIKNDDDASMSGLEKVEVT